MSPGLSSCSEICYETQKNTSKRVFVYGILKARGMELQLNFNLKLQLQKLQFFTHYSKQFNKRFESIFKTQFCLETRSSLTSSVLLVCDVNHRFRVSWNNTKKLFQKIWFVISRCFENYIYSNIKSKLLLTYPRNLQKIL